MRSVQCSEECTVYTLNFAGSNFRRLPIFTVFVFLFSFCDVIAQALPVRSKFSLDETFVDGY